MLINSNSGPTADLSLHGAGDEYQPRILAVAGRIGRLRYIVYSLLVTLPFPLTAVLAVSSLSLGNISLVLSFGFLLLSVGGALIEAKRRVNDLDLSGWIVWLMLIPGLNLFLLLFLVFARGTDGRNKYGPKPNDNPRGMIVALIMPALVMAGLIALLVIASRLH